jgi:hypothetical protein
MIAHIISFIAFTSVLAPNVANVKAAAILPRKYEVGCLPTPCKTLTLL